MNRAWTRSLRSAYRREPVFSFVLTVGTVNAVIGGVDGHWALMILGLGTAVAAIVLRWWLNQQRIVPPIQSSPIRYLPAQSSRQSLPLLTPSKHRK